MDKKAYLLLLSIFTASQMNIASAAEGSGTEEAPLPPQPSRQELQKKAILGYLATAKDKRLGKSSNELGEQKLPPEIKAHIQQFSAQLNADAFNSFTCPPVKMIQELYDSGQYGNLNFSHDGINFKMFMPRLHTGRQISFTKVVCNQKEGPFHKGLYCVYSASGYKDTFVADVVDGQFDTEKCTFEGGELQYKLNDNDRDVYIAKNPEDIKIQCK